MARIAVAIYPAISMCLARARGAARVLVGAARRRRSRWCSAARRACSLGDVVFALGDAGRIVVNERLLEVPYPARAGGDRIGRPAPVDPLPRPAGPPAVNTMSRGRLFAVAAALLAPIVVIAIHDMSSARR